jgi:hypothetical protein
MVSDHFRRQLRQQQHRKSSEASNGYLVRRLRSLRDADRRAATTSLRGGGGRYCTTTPGGSSNPLLLSSSRKRRRGGGVFAAAGDRPDPNPSTLDVTVSGPPPSSSDPAFVGGGGGGTIVLLAYVHLHTVATRPSGECDGRRDGGTTLPGFAHLVMSRDAMREMGIVGGGRARNLRLHGAIVIPQPRSAAAVTKRTDADGDGANRDNDDECRMIGGMPTIVCTNVCKEYPVDQPPLRDVSFDGFSSTVMYNGSFV